MPFPSCNPIDAGWFERRTPVDHLGAAAFDCPGCAERRDGERYRAILGGHGGVGAPIYVQPFLKRKRTAGKTGRRSHWIMCCSCQALVPDDDAATELAAGLGLPRGFGVEGP